VRSLRWGLWEIGPTFDLLSQRLRVLNVAIDQVAGEGGLIHLSIDLGGLTGNVSTGLKLVDRIAAHVAPLRDQNQIEAVTVAECAARLSRTRHNSPARSILRPAA
jgi:hypothetical protein